MAKIVLVHGMRMQHLDRRVLEARWQQALIRGLRATTWGRRNPGSIPGKADIELVYWGDLFRENGGAPRTGRAKGLDADDLRAFYYGLLRRMVRAADRLSFWDHRGRPRGPMARLVNPLVQQTAVYMANGQVQNVDHRHEPGAYFQIQARFDAALGEDTRVVIGHSLGTVIAYEGLCRRPHRVSSFVTVGSPIATPRLILQPLRERQQRELKHSPDQPPLWPGVDRWTNFFSPADVWSVPIKRLAPVFDRRIRDIEVVHGNPLRFVETHKLTTYLKHGRLCDEIARALADDITAPAEARLAHAS